MRKMEQKVRFMRNLITLLREVILFILINDWLIQKSP